MSSLFKNLALALLIALIVGAMYYAIGGESAPDIEGVSDSDIRMRNTRILSDIQKIDTYTMDVSLFEDERFKSLVDHRKEITDVGTGRPNPFDPIQ